MEADHSDPTIRAPTLANLTFRFAMDASRVIGRIEGNAMVKRTARNGFLLPVALCLLLVGASTATALPPELPAVTAPPKELGLDPFYTRYLSAHGLPVVGSSKVSDYALREAAYLADQMLAHRPEVRDAMIRNKVRLAVMAYSERTTDIPEHRDLQPKLYWNIRARPGSQPPAAGRQLRRGEPAQLQG
jgi:hypothetical protein